MSSEKDLKKPIKFTGQGICPICNKNNMIYSHFSAEHIVLDEYGLPMDEANTYRDFIECPVCGFLGNIGKEFIKLEDGSYKYVTEAERIYEENRMKNLKPITHLHANGNPFMKEENE